MNSCGTFSLLNYNIHDNKNNGSDGTWRQYRGKSFKINENFRARKADNGGNSFNRGRWSLEEKKKEKTKTKKCTAFISAYRPCKNTTGINTVWKQQVRFSQKED